MRVKINVNQGGGPTRSDSNKSNDNSHFAYGQDPRNQSSGPSSDSRPKVVIRANFGSDDSDRGAAGHHKDKRNKRRHSKVVAADGSYSYSYSYSYSDSDKGVVGARRRGSSHRSKKGGAWAGAGEAGGEDYDEYCSNRDIAICVAITIIVLILILVPTIIAYNKGYLPNNQCIVGLKTASNNTFTSGLGVNGSAAGVPGTFQIFARSCRNRGFPFGGDIYEGSLVKIDNTSEVVELMVTDNGDGTYDASYVATVVGYYTMAVNLVTDDSARGHANDPVDFPQRREPIQGSPFNVYIYPRGSDRTSGTVEGGTNSTTTNPGDGAHTGVDLNDPYQNPSPGGCTGVSFDYATPPDTTGNLTYTDHCNGTIGVDVNSTAGTVEVIAVGPPPPPADADNSQVCQSPSVHCYNPTCDPITFQFVKCTSCENGYWGPNCLLACSDSKCNSVTQCGQDYGNAMTCDMCNPGYYGTACTSICASSSCSSGAVCDNSGALLSCDVCAPGTYGPLCASTCTTNVAACNGPIQCDRVSGALTQCSSCMDGAWGANCTFLCTSQTGTCNGTIRCSMDDGSTVACPSGCVEGFYGADCLTACVAPNAACMGVTCDQVSGSATMCDACGANYYGATCNQMCVDADCAGNITCQQVTGTVEFCDACVQGKWGDVCQYTCDLPANCLALTNGCSKDAGIVTQCTGCVAGYYGPACQYKCDMHGNCNGVQCNQATGAYASCTSCQPGKFGTDCTSSCSLPTNCASATCNFADGTSPVCTSCTSGHYGSQCGSACANCGTCDFTTGVCTTCASGYAGLPSCSVCANSGCTDCSCTACLVGFWGGTCQNPCSPFVGCSASNTSCAKSDGSAPKCHKCDDPHKYDTGAGNCNTNCPLPNGNCNTNSARCTYNPDDTALAPVVASCDSCIAGTWGTTCEGTCSSALCDTTICDKITGQPSSCSSCVDGYTNCTLLCTEKCTLPLHCITATCDPNGGNVQCTSCDPGYYGTSCGACSTNAPCMGTTTCDFNFQTPLYCESCAAGFYGDICTGQCALPTQHCLNPSCDRDGTNVVCGSCSPGFYGAQCQAPCQQMPTSTCTGVTSCNQQTGQSTSCASCASGKWGPLCGSTCPAHTNCIGTLVCNKTDGTTQSCAACSVGFYGQLCASPCTSQNDHCNAPYTCSSTGTVTNCGSCVAGSFGATCNRTCVNTNPTCFGTPTCNKNSGVLSSCPVCQDGYWGPTCTATCVNPSTCKGTPICDKTTGVVSMCGGCADGFLGLTCQTPCGANCASCNGTATNCITCVPGKFGLPTCGTTSSCNGNCATCPVGSPDSCNTCIDGYYGAALGCTTRCHQDNCVGPVSCTDAGVVSDCSASGCFAGFYGPTCSSSCATSASCLTATCDFVGGTNRICTSCAAGSYGDDCTGTCANTNCASGIVCSHDGVHTLSCATCQPGWFGETCQTRCGSTDQCANATTCDAVTGAPLTCSSCFSGWSSADCSAECSVPVNCTGAVTCDQMDNALTCENCVAGTYGSHCQFGCAPPINCAVGTPFTCDRSGAPTSCGTCKVGFYGPVCGSTCTFPATCDNTGTIECAKEDGSAVTCSACKATTPTFIGYWGERCQHTAIPPNAFCMAPVNADKVTGVVDKCTKCATGTWGNICDAQCILPQKCASGATCDQSTGACVSCDTCNPGYYLDVSNQCTACGPLCTTCTSATDCISCTPNNLFPPSCGTTTICAGNCETCANTLGGNATCSSCVAGYWGLPSCGTACSAANCVGQVLCNDATGAVLGCPGGCAAGFFGGSCASTCMPPTAACSGIVTCNQAGAPQSCSSCVDGFYGDLCQSSCAVPTQCTGVNSCYQANGAAVSCSGCQAGLYGQLCSTSCVAPNRQCVGTTTCDQISGKALTCGSCTDGFWGPTCSQTCRTPDTCVGVTTCDQNTGAAVQCSACAAGFLGLTCDAQCVENCAACDGDATACTSCADGWMNLPGCLVTTNCIKPCTTCSSDPNECFSCVATQWGLPSCGFSCPVPASCLGETECTDDGTTVTACPGGCVDGKWGTMCEKTCAGVATCTGAVVCDQVTGLATQCVAACPAGSWGALCEKTCSTPTQCTGTTTCDRVSGAMVSCTGCTSGYWGLTQGCRFPCAGNAQCSGALQCDVTTGSLTSCAACADGYWGAACLSSCASNASCVAVVRCDKASGATALCAGCVGNKFGATCGASCNPQCATCSNDADNCQSCAPTYLFAPKCAVTTSCSGNCATCTSNAAGACVTCRDGRYGPPTCNTLCVNSARCNGTATCDVTSGVINNCVGTCAAGYYGPACDKTCRSFDGCSGTVTCDINTGAALSCSACTGGRYGPLCATKCPVPASCKGSVSSCAQDTGTTLACSSCADGYYGASCLQACAVPTNCVGTVKCSSTNTNPQCSACKTGFTGSTCSSACPVPAGCAAGSVDCDGGTGSCKSCSACVAGYYGDSCGTTCKADNCLAPVTCDKKSGAKTACQSGCADGYFGPLCQYTCATPSRCVGAVKCNQTGTTTSCTNCTAGYWGPLCDKTCLSPLANALSNPCLLPKCIPLTGLFIGCTTCATGYTGTYCNYTVTPPVPYTPPIVIYVQPKYVDGSQTVYRGAGVMDGMAGAYRTFTMITYNNDGSAVTTGGVNLVVRVSSGNSSYPVTITDFNNGTYAGAYTAVAAGAYRLTATFGGNTTTNNVSFTLNRNPAPVITSAAFTATYSAIKVTFNVPTNTGGSNSTDCSVLFGTSVAQSFGYTSTCIWSDKATLIISITAGVTFAPGATLAFTPAAGVFIYTDAANSFVVNTTVSVVAPGPANTYKPIARLTGPNQVRACDSLAIDASSSTGPNTAASPLSYTWKLEMGQQFFGSDSLGGWYGLNDASMLNFSSPDLLRGGMRYTFSVQVSNLFGGFSDKAYINVTKLVGNPPSLRIDYPATAAVGVDKDLTIPAVASGLDCYGNAVDGITYSWSISPALVVAVPLSNSQLVLPKYSLTARKNYTVKVQAWVTSCPTSINTAWVNISTLTQALVPVITGGNTQVSRRGSSRYINLAADASYDPDYPAGDASYKSYPFKYEWKCSDITDPNKIVSPCKTRASKALSFANNNTLMTDAQQFAPSTTLMFTLTLSRAAPPARSSQLTTTITILADPAPSISINTTDNINATRDDRVFSAYLMAGAYDGDTYSAVQTWLWEVVSGSVTLNGTTSRVLTIQDAALTQSTVYVLRCTATDGNGYKGAATVAFRTREPPAGGSCYPSPATGQVLSTPFSVACTGFVSDADLMPLTYRFSTAQAGGSLLLINKVSVSSCTYGSSPKTGSFGIVSPTKMFVSAGCRGTFQYNGVLVDCWSNDFVYQECTLPLRAVSDWQPAATVTGLLLPLGNITVMVEVQNGAGYVYVNYITVLVTNTSGISIAKAANTTLAAATATGNPTAVTNVAGAIADTLNVNNATGTGALRINLVNAVVNATTTITDATVKAATGALNPILTAATECNNTHIDTVVGYIATTVTGANTNNMTLSKDTIASVVKVLDQTVTTSNVVNNGTDVNNDGMATQRDQNVTDCINAVATAAIKDAPCGSAGADLSGSNIGISCQKLCTDDLQKGQSLPNKPADDKIITVSVTCGATPSDNTSARTNTSGNTVAALPTGNTTAPTINVAASIITNAVTANGGNATSVTATATVQANQVSGDNNTRGLVTPTVSLTLTANTVDATGKVLHVDTRIPKAGAVTKGTIRYDLYQNVPGYKVIDLEKKWPKFPNSPDSTSYLTSFNAPVNQGVSMGGYLSGYLFPPVTGTYNFHLLSDDYAELRLSSDETYNNTRVVAFVSGSCNDGEWTKYPSQISAPLQLSVGNIYYIEAIYKNGAGGDRLSVGWNYTGSPNRAIIDGAYLAPYNPKAPLPAAPYIYIDIPRYVNDSTLTVNNVQSQRANDIVLTLPTQSSIRPECGYRVEANDADPSKVVGSYSSDGCAMTATSLGSVTIRVGGEAWPTKADRGLPRYTVTFGNYQMTPTAFDVPQAVVTPDPVTNPSQIAYRDLNFPALFSDALPGKCSVALGQWSVKGSGVPDGTTIISDDLTLAIISDKGVVQLSGTWRCRDDSSNMEFTFNNSFSAKVVVSADGNTMTTNPAGITATRVGTVPARSVRIRFVEKGALGNFTGGDRNLWIDSITVGGVRIPATDSRVRYFPVGKDANGTTANKIFIAGQSRMTWAGVLEFDVSGILTTQQVVSYRCGCTHLSTFAVRMTPTPPPPPPVEEDYNPELPPDWTGQLGIAIGVGIGLIVLLSLLALFLFHKFCHPNKATPYNQRRAAHQAHRRAEASNRTGGWRAPLLEGENCVENLWDEDRKMIYLFICVIGGLVMCAAALGLIKLAADQYVIFGGESVIGVYWYPLFILPQLLNIVVAINAMVASGTEQEAFLKVMPFIGVFSLVVDIVLFGILMGVVLIGSTNIICDINADQALARTACKQMAAMLGLLLCSIVIAILCAFGYIFVVIKRLRVLQRERIMKSREDSNTGSNKGQKSYSNKSNDASKDVSISKGLSNSSD